VLAVDPFITGGFVPGALENPRPAALVVVDVVDFVSDIGSGDIESGGGESSFTKR
jgi:hypothetical protein